MTCRELAEFIADYLSNELPDPIRRQFDEHLQICPNCERYLATYRHTIELGRRAFDDEDAPVPASVPDELVKTILALRKA